MVEREAKFFALFFGKALVESLDKSFGIRLFLCLAKQGAFRPESSRWRRLP